MTLSPTSRRLRWLAPAAVAALVAGAAFTSNATSASGAPKLPGRTAAELLAAMQDANPAGLSGTVVQTSKLGLPTLPTTGDGQGSGASLSLQSLVTGSRTARVWWAGETRQRVAILGQLSESNIVHNGSDLWTYTSATRRVTHTKINQPDDVRGRAKDMIGATPMALAVRTLEAIDPTTTVEVDDTARVAGRATYQLLVKPRDTRSLIGSIRIAIDSETSVPLRVQVYARAAEKPAIELGFTDVSFQVPSNSVFTFVPPAGTTVVEESLDSTILGRGQGYFNEVDPSEIRKLPPGNGSTPPKSNDGREHSDSNVLGKGWTAVRVLPTEAGVSGPVSQIFDRIAERVPGGSLVTSALVSVLITDEGKVYIGAVDGAALQQVASTGRGL